MGAEVVTRHAGLAVADRAVLHAGILPDVEHGAVDARVFHALLVGQLEEGGGGVARVALQELLVRDHRRPREPLPSWDESAQCRLRLLLASIIHSAR